MNRRACLLAIGLATAGCNDMVRQPRYDDYAPGPLFSDGKALQAPPDGTIARDIPAAETIAIRPPMSLALLRRGQARYAIDCAMCHGLDGSGDGTVPARGFPRPADFRLLAQRALGAERIVAVIANGSGSMFGHADRVSPADRWAIAAYVQALQRTGS